MSLVSAPSPSHPVLALSFVIPLVLLLPSLAGAQFEAPAAPPQGSNVWALSTFEGTLISMRGPWRIEGRRVLFTSADGQLTSVRSSSIDWEGSKALYAPRARKRTAATRERKTAALVLTNNEVGSYESPVEETGPEGLLAMQPVRVVSWEPSTDAGPVAIFGTLRNDGSAAAREINVIVSLYDETHELITRKPAKLVTGSLSPGKTTNFRVFFDDVYNGQFATANFGVKSRVTKVTSPDEKQPPQ